MNLHFYDDIGTIMVFADSRNTSYPLAYAILKYAASVEHAHYIWVNEGPDTCLGRYIINNAWSVSREYDMSDICDGNDERGYYMLWGNMRVYRDTNAG